MFKLLKWTIVGGLALLVTGGIFFGKDLFSYASSSGRVLKTAVKESIPVQFEIQRARDLLEDLIPEMHANLRLVATEEVEVAQLEKEVVKDKEVIGKERGIVQRMRESLDTRPVSAGGADEDRKRFLEDLSQRFDRFRTAEMLLSGKEKLLQNRRKSLGAAIQRLEKTRLARVELAAQIEALEGQFRLIQAQGAASDLQLNETKLAQTQRCLTDLKKRLEIAQRVLEREVHFSEAIPETTVSAGTLAEEIDEHFSKGSRGAVKPSAATEPRATADAVPAPQPAR